MHRKYDQGPTEQMLQINPFRSWDLSVHIKVRTTVYIPVYLLLLPLL